VIELILVLPLFLLPFPLFLLDFAHAGIEMNRVHSASRVAVWQRARHDDDAAHPSEPGPSELDSLVFDYGTLGRLRGDTPVVSASSDETWAYWGAIGSASAPAGGSDDTHFDGGLLGNFFMDVGRRFPRFMIGGVGRTQATVSHAGKGFWIPRYPKRTTFTASHYLVGDTARETDPLDAEGWFDPIKRAKDTLLDAFD
jgi:hypothetical protein